MQLLDNVKGSMKFYLETPTKCSLPPKEVNYTTKRHLFHGIILKFLEA